MRSRIVYLSTLVPSLSVANVWDLPLWAWRDYADLHDAHQRALEKQARENA